MANPKFVLRSLDVFAMYGLNNLPPFGSPGPAAILAAINKEQGIALESRQVAIGTPSATSGDMLFNTNLLLTAVSGQGLKGTYTVRYNRADAALASALNNRVLPGNSSFNAATTHELIPLLNSASGLTLVAADIVNEPIAPGTNSFNVKAAATSFFFLPGTTFKVYAGEIVQPPWMLFDINQLADLAGSGATAIPTNTAKDETYLIDGEPSLRINAGGGLRIVFGSVFDSSIPEWTLEWSSRLNATSTTYSNLLYVSNATTVAFINRTSDQGYGYRIQNAPNSGVVQGDVWNFPFGSAAKLGVLTRYAAVKKNGVITMYVDGVATLMANGTTNVYTSASLPAGAGVTNCDRIEIGGLAQNISHVRLSKYARYSANYTPKPFKSPSFATVAPVTNALGFDPES